MARLRLTTAFWDYDRVRPLIDGTIQPEGIEITPVISRPSETFFRMLRHQEFEVSELSFANYTMLRARGDDSFIAIPVFPSRLFRHSCIYVNKEAGINEPKDLAGKKIRCGFELSILSGPGDRLLQQFHGCVRPACGCGSHKLHVVVAISSSLPRFLPFLAFLPLFLPLFLAFLSSSSFLDFLALLPFSALATAS